MASRPREPSTAPHPEQWYPIVLGSSLKDQPSKRYYSLRYEFKPASIDTSRPGTLHKGAENKVTVEFCNNQPGKANVAFQGVNEDCKDSDAVLFFDGKSFRLERLHRAVKTLRHLRLPGESAGSASNLVPNAETRTSPVHLNGHAAASAADDHRPRVSQEQVEEIVLGSQHEPSAGGLTKKSAKPAKPSRNKPSPVPSPPRKRTSPSLLDIVDDDVDMEAAAKRPKPDTNNTNTNTNNNINTNSVEHIDVNIDDDEGEEHESEYEVEDIDVSDDEEQQQQQQEQQQQQQLPTVDQPVQPTSSDKPQSSSSSGSSSSGSGSGSGSDSSSDSDGSDDESLGDI